MQGGRRVTAKLSKKEDKLKAVTESLDTLTKYCNKLENQNKPESVVSNNPIKRANLSEDLISLGHICFSEDDDESKCDCSVITFTTLTSVPESQPELTKE